MTTAEATQTAAGVRQSAARPAPAGNNFRSLRAAGPAPRTIPVAIPAKSWESANATGAMPTSHTAAKLHRIASSSPGPVSIDRFSVQPKTTWHRTAQGQASGRNARLAPRTAPAACSARLPSGSK